MRHIYILLHFCQFLLKNPRSKALIEEGNKYENTPLHAAAQKGYVKIVQVSLLLRDGLWKHPGRAV